MTVLSDTEIKAAITAKQILLNPLPTEDQYGTSSLDLRLGKEFREFVPITELARSEPKGVERPIIIDLANVQFGAVAAQYTRDLPLEKDGSFILEPEKFVLSATLERVELPRSAKIAARVEGRSTPARLGLVVHLTAPTIHAGFGGNIVLEMFNYGNYPLRLRPGYPICQLIFERLGQLPSSEMTSQHQGQTGVVSKKIVK